MDIDVAEVERTLQISQAHVSLDAPMTPGEDNRLIDYLPDAAERSADAATMEHALTEGIETVFKSLRDREAKILRLYFGLDGPDPMTLEEIGAMMGITRERVRQIRRRRCCGSGMRGSSRHSTPSWGECRFAEVSRES